MSDLLAKILGSDESESLDFKVEWHQNPACLLHDILCLANARFKGDRHLVLGVDDDGTVVGVPTTNRKTQAQLNDFVRASRINIMPSILVKTFQHEGHEIDVVKIKHSPEKPFFLTQDYAFQGKTVRAGVVYSRIADTNTPLNGCLDDKKIEEMYRERFRIDQTPLQRLSYLLDDLSNWEHNGDRSSTFFNSYWPEMRIVQEALEDDTNLRVFDEAWVKVFPDTRAYRYSLEIVYMGTVLKTLYWITCDGGRYQSIMPNHKVEKISGSTWRKFYYFIEGTLEYKVNRMLQNVYPLHETSWDPSVMIFRNHFEKDQFFHKFLREKNVPVPYYQQSGSGRTYKEEKILPNGNRLLLNK